jgi:hypothetical protein
VITLELAQQLHDAGLAWEASAGDRFVVPDRDMDDDVFVVSDMTVQVHDFPSGRIIGFNGTTEWALDSLDQHDVVWLPRETQLRELLGEEFVSLEARTGGYAVRLASDDERHIDIDAERAYARALLAVLRKGPAEGAEGSAGH